MKMSAGLAVWGGWMFLGLTARPLHAQVVLNEVQAAPSSGDEWIELRNASDQPVPLHGWILIDLTGELTTLPSLTTIASLSAQELVVVEVKNRLNNSGDSISLQTSNGQRVDHFTYSHTNSQLSWSRQPDGSWQLGPPSRGQPNPLPTPTNSVTPSMSPTVVPTSSPLPPSPSFTPLPQPSPSVNPLPSLLPTPSPTTTPTLGVLPTSPSPISAPRHSLPLQLSEVMSCPLSGEREWIEFYNPNVFVVELPQWRAKDLTGNTRILTGTIPGFGFAAIELASPMLNNSGDRLLIVTADQEPVIQLDLPECQPNHSIIFYDGQWQPTAQSSKGTTNLHQPLPEVTLSTAPLQLEWLSTSQLSTQTAGTAETDHDQLALSYQFHHQTTGESATTAGLLAATAPTSLTTLANHLSPSVTANGSPHNQRKADAAVQPVRLAAGWLWLLFLLSCLGLAGGGVGVYQWYTERRVNAILQTV